jgi:hypothetical protein
MQKGLGRRGNSGFGFGSLERTGIPSISIGGILLFVCISGAEGEVVAETVPDVPDSLLEKLLLAF